jgi:hypothetical protein
MPLPGFGGFELQSCALDKACFAQLVPGPMMQVPPADAHALPIVDDEVQPIRIVPSTTDGQSQHMAMRPRGWCRPAASGTKEGREVRSTSFFVNAIIGPYLRQQTSSE